MKIYFVMYMRGFTFVNIKLCVCAPTNENGTQILYFNKNGFENLKKLESILIFLSFS